ncbi:hypothetical protein EMPG_15205 [Blastomyces silverae]|uniref:Uncharacterized protein n=1 Tax=Blastomyces silverae TaxID=2060906 RepID=A0A0H1BEA6_9EURO|nr:hypothetical protein EMPG_15205 [Blastomyces silverae]
MGLQTTSPSPDRYNKGNIKTAKDNYGMISSTKEKGKPAEQNDTRPTSTLADIIKRSHDPASSPDQTASARQTTSQTNHRAGE